MTASLSVWRSVCMIFLATFLKKGRYSIKGVDNYMNTHALLANPVSNVSLQYPGKTMQRRSKEMKLNNPALVRKSKGVLVPKSAKALSRTCKMPGKLLCPEGKFCFRSDQLGMMIRIYEMLQNKKRKFGWSTLKKAEDLLIGSALNSPWKDVREWATMSLKQLGWRAEQRIIKALTNCNPYVRNEQRLFWEREERDLGQRSTLLFVQSRAISVRGCEPRL